MTNLKAIFRLVLVNNSINVIPIYKAKTFICKNSAIFYVKYRLNIANITKKTLKSVIMLKGEVKMADEKRPKKI
jgi:hypothetical protein